MVVARGWEEENGESLLNEYRVLVLQDEEVPVTIVAQQCDYT